MSDARKALERIALALAAAALSAAAIAFVASPGETWKLLLVVGTACLAVGLGALSSWRTYQFTAWVVAAVTTAMLYPQVFQPYETSSPEYKWLLLLLIQAVMFGMGTQITLRDFAGVARQPGPVAIGLLCQFTIMPLVGYSLAVAFKLPPEIAAGMVLIGSCSSGLASNVMAYLARADLALSITLTAVATMLAPVLTPFWMSTLASGLLKDNPVDVSFFTMMAGIIKIVVVPTGAALLHDYLKHGSQLGCLIVRSLAAIGFLSLLATALGLWPTAITHPGEGSGLAFELSQFFLGGFAFGVLYHQATRWWPSLDRYMPTVAMIGIIYVTGMTTAEGRTNLMLVGSALVAAAVLHNVLGYILGYWMSRLLGLDAQSARTVAFEVGLQNGGMATGLAAGMGKLGTLGLPAAIFIAWMNVSGSMLANYWRRRPPGVDDDPLTEETHP